MKRHIVFLGLLLLVSILTGCPPPEVVDFYVCTPYLFGDIHLAQGYDWDCCPTCMKMWAKCVARMTRDNAGLSFDAVRCSDYDYRIQTAYDDKYVKEEYRGTVASQADLAQTSLDLVREKAQDYGVLVPWDSSSADEPAEQTGTFVVDPAYLNDKSGLDPADWNDESGDIRHIIYTTLFDHELFAHLVALPLAQQYYDLYGDQAYDEFEPVFLFMKQYFPYPVDSVDVSSITSVGRADPTKVTVDSISTDDVDAFLSELFTWCTYGLDPAQFHDGMNYSNRALLLLTMNEPNDLSQGLHVVLLTGIHVHFPDGVPHDWAHAEVTYLLHNPGPGYDAYYEVLTPDELKGRVALTNSGAKILYYKCMGIYLGENNYGRATTGARGLSGTDPTAIPNQDDRKRFDFYIEKTKRERIKKAWPAILKLLLD